jgi:teichuronic acid exporter
MFYPLHALNLNMLNVKGRSDLFLKLEIVKKIMAIPTIIIGVIWGIKIMIAGIIVNTLIGYYLNSYWSGKLIGYSFKQQIFDILPSFLLALAVSGIVYSFTFWMNLSSGSLLLIQLLAGALLTVSFCEIIKLKDYLYIKELVFEKFASMKNRKNGKTR